VLDIDGSTDARMVLENISLGKRPSSVLEIKADSTTEFVRPDLH
jgi:hypothetical protein